MRRIVLHVQHDGEASDAAAIVGLRERLGPLLAGQTEIELMSDDELADPRRRSLALRWREAVTFDDGTRYRPVILKLRSTTCRDRTMPVLSSIRGLPVLDMRFLAEDYLRKAAKTDENGMRRIISGSQSALVEMMSSFDLGLVLENVEAGEL